MQIACFQKCFHSTTGPKLLKKKKNLQYSFLEGIIIIPRKCKAHIRFACPNLIGHPGVRHREAESRDVSSPRSLTQKSWTTLLSVTAILKLLSTENHYQEGAVWASAVRICIQIRIWAQVSDLLTLWFGTCYPISLCLCFPIFKLMRAIRPKSQHFVSYTI